MYIRNKDLVVEESSSDDSSSETQLDEEALIKYYFRRGFSYEEILLLLKKQHNHEISYSTLLRRLNAYGLSRRGFFTKGDSNSCIQMVRQRVSEIVDGPGSSGGYRTIWHTLDMEGLRVPRIVVQDM